MLKHSKKLQFNCKSPYIISPKGSISSKIAIKGVHEADIMQHCLP